MKKQKGVSHKEWSALYEAAIEFRKLECWTWMRDDDLFGVRNPETGETGYCCVMGTLGEVFALNVYMGAEGLNSYRTIRDQFSLMSEGVEIDRRALFNSQKCLMASFEDRNDLHKNDLGVIRKLGLKFRGRNQWPLFRSYQPDFAPWFISGEEAVFLTEALRRTAEMALRLRSNPDLLDHPDGDEEQYLVRTLREGKWRDIWEPPDKYEPPETVPIINETLLARLKRAKLARSGAWITDCAVLPAIIGDREKPYHPYGFPILEKGGTAIDMELLKPEEVDAELPNKFMEIIQKTKNIPLSLAVGSDRAFGLLEPVAKALKIQIQRSDKLPELKFFLKGMEEFFER